MHDGKWRFLDSGAGSAVFHMALDEAILDAVSREASPPTFRLFEWDSAAITIGFSQKGDAGIDFPRCEADGVTVTRRLTGGRAVYHDRETAYSVIAPTNDTVFGGSIADTCREIGRVLIDALSSLGVQAEWSRGTPPETVAPGESTGRAPCFLSASRHEITVGGKKLVGSAQRRIGKVFLQQGSILIGPGRERMADYLADREGAERISTALLEKSIDLSVVMRHPLKHDDLKCALFDALERKLAGTEVFRGEPSPEEMDHTLCSMHERYGAKGWVMGYDPKADL